MNEPKSGTTLALEVTVGRLQRLDRRDVATLREAFALYTGER